MEDAYGRQKAGSNPITGLQPYTVEPDLILQVRMERHFCSPSLVCMPISHSLTHSLAFKQQLLLQSEGHFPPSFTSAQSARAGAPRGRLRSLSSLPDLESTGALLLVLRDSLSYRVEELLHVVAVLRRRFHKQEIVRLCVAPRILGVHSPQIL
eukprot:GHVU01222179.1.p1 GENE.GHVU01222179.1~~GHVU01222179.1.p1  ORF type:complete len:153 (+),score=6.38 GHVU01222179.1:727-1185(+)